MRKFTITFRGKRLYFPVSPSRDDTSPCLYPLFRHLPCTPSFHTPCLLTYRLARITSRQVCIPPYSSSCADISPCIITAAKACRLWCFAALRAPRVLPKPRRAPVCSSSPCATVACLRSAAWKAGFSWKAGRTGTILYHIVAGSRRFAIFSMLAMKCKRSLPCGEPFKSLPHGSRCKSAWSSLWKRLICHYRHWQHTLPSARANSSAVFMPLTGKACVLIATNRVAAVCCQYSLPPAQHRSPILPSNTVFTTNRTCNAIFSALLAKPRPACAARSRSKCLPPGPIRACSGIRAFLARGAFEICRFRAIPPAPLADMLRFSLWRLL